MITLAELQSDLELYRTARRNILTSGQSFGGAGGRSLTMADLKWIDTQIRELEQRIAQAQNKGRLPSYTAVFGGHRG